jgi:hypothetical protein
MVDVFFAYLIIKFTADFQIWAHIAFTKAMITSEEYFISQSMLADISLDYFK